MVSSIRGAGRACGLPEGGGGLNAWIREEGIEEIGIGRRRFKRSRVGIIVNGVWKENTGVNVGRLGVAV